MKIIKNKNKMEKPTQEVVYDTYEIIQNLPDNIELLRCVASIEGGMHLAFKNKSGHVLFVELYNDNCKGYISEDPIKKEIIKNEEVFSSEEILEAIKDFYNKL
jgi:hypothetical protein